MRPKDWIKIFAGMFVIFAVGMFVVSGVSAGKRKVEEVAHSSNAITLPMLGVAFKMNDNALGGMQKLRVERSAPDRIESFHLTVKLDEGVDVDQFDDCELTVVDATQIDEHTTFTCLTDADPGFDQLVNFGTIKFLPSNETHRLMLPRDVRDEIRNVKHGNGDEVVTTADDGNLSVKVNGAQVVDIQGSEAGGRVLIRDPQTGKVIVDIQGDEAGGRVKIDGTVPEAPPAATPPKAPVKPSPAGG